MVNAITVKVPEGMTHVRVTKKGNLIFMDDDFVIGIPEDKESYLKNQYTGNKHIGGIERIYLEKVLRLDKTAESLDIYYNLKTKELVPFVFGQYVIAPRIYCEIL